MYKPIFLMQFQFFLRVQCDSGKASTNVVQMVMKFDDEGGVVHDKSRLVSFLVQDMVPEMLCPGGVNLANKNK